MYVLTQIIEGHLGSQKVFTNEKEAVGCLVDEVNKYKSATILDNKLSSNIRDMLDGAGYMPTFRDHEFFSKVKDILPEELKGGPLLDEGIMLQTTSFKDIHIFYLKEFSLSV